MTESLLNAFQNFISDARTKYKNQNEVHRPLSYVDKLFSFIETASMLDKIDPNRFYALIKKCEAAKNLDIFPHLYELADWLVKVVKEYSETGDKEMTELVVIKENNSNNNVDKPICEYQVKEETLNNNVNHVNNEKDNQVKEAQNKTDQTNNTELTETDKKIKEIQNKRKASETPLSVVSKDNETPDIDEDDDGFLTKKDRKILKKMEKYDHFLQKLNVKIQELEEKELDLEELDNSESNYLADNILKKRFNDAYKELRKLCCDNPHLVDGELPQKVVSLYKKPISFKNSQYPEINVKVTNMLEKRRKNAIKKGGKAKEEIFPDYFDVLEWIEAANKESSLNFSKEKVEDTAKQTFKDIGSILKNRRKKDMESTFDARVEECKDLPKFDTLNQDEELNKKLNENKKIAVVKQEKIIEEYVNKQVNNVEAADNSATSESEDNCDEEKGAIDGTNKDLSDSEAEQDCDKENESSTINGTEDASNSGDNENCDEQNEDLNAGTNKIPLESEIVKKSIDGKSNETENDLPNLKKNTPKKALLEKSEDDANILFGTSNKKFKKEHVQPNVDNEHNPLNYQTKETVDKVIDVDDDDDCIVLD